MFEIDFCVVFNYYRLREIRVNVELLNLGNGKIIKLLGNREEIVIK